MNRNFYLKFTKWTAAYLSCLTMVFAPVAMGKEAEEMTQKNAQQLVKELGLDKKMTLGEFWEKNKALVPGYVYRDLENFVKENKNLQMPEVTTDVSKATDGSEIPLLRVSKDGKTQTIQLFGEKEKWAKFNGVTITELDLERVEDVFKRIEGSDIKLKRQGDKYRKNKSEIQNNSAEQIQLETYKKDFSRFNGFPRVTPQMWKSLTKEQRVNYIVKMRLMWLNARKVLAGSSAPAAPTKRTKPSAAIENFYKIIFGENAQAKAPALAPPPGQLAGKATPSAEVRVQGTSVRVKDKNSGATKVVQIPYNADTCVVAGYIGAYGKVNNVRGDNRDGCSIDLALATYKNNPNLEFVQKANDSCSAKGSSLVACNPIIYGYPNGSEACIDKRSAEYQQATHFTSPGNRETCDGKSRLASTDEIIKFNDKDYSNIQPREKQIAAIEADQQKDDYALTNSYLKGVLAKKDGIMVAMLEKGEWNLALDEELVKIQSQFEEEIDRAIKTCEADFAKTVTSSGAATTREANQKLACDQLHRRWLFTERAIAKLRDKACLKPALYIGNYNANEASYADSAKEKTALNKRTIDAKGTELCECPSDTPTAAAPVTEALVAASGDSTKAKGKKVSFGEKCEARVAPIIPPVVPAKCADGLDATKVDGIDVCACKNNRAIFVKPGEPAPQCERQAPKCDKPEGIAGFNYEQCKCDDNKKLKFTTGDDGGYECEGKNWLPWILGGLGILALLFFFFKKKKKDPPPPVVVTPPAQCPAGKTGTPPNCVCSNTCSVGNLNPTTCACNVVPPALCTPPKIGTPPACTCPAAPSYCTPPQKIYNASTCQCTDVPQPPTCADGSVAPGGNLTSCPKCPDGSYKTTSSSTRPGGCPAEGGGGNNCPQGGCSGGLPGTGN